MSRPLTNTAHDDAPLSAAKNPDPMAADAELSPQHGDVLVGRTVTINRAREDLYTYWRDFRNLPRFMHNIQSVTIQSATAFALGHRGASRADRGVGLGNHPR